MHKSNQTQYQDVYFTFSANYCMQV